MSLVYLLVVFLLAALVTGAANHLALNPWRQARRRGEHWTESARHLYPANVAAASCGWAIPANLALGSQILDLEGTPHWLWVAIAGSMGVLAGNRGLALALFPSFQFRDWLHQALAGWVAQFLSWIALLGCIVLMPEEPSWQMAVVTALYVATMAFYTSRYVPLLRALGLVRPAPVELSELAGNVAKRMHVPLKRVWLLVTPSAQAAALPNSGELLFSRCIVELLDGAELAAVCAHEIGHLSESRGTGVVRFLCSLYLVPLLFIHPLLHWLGVPGLVVALLGVVGLGRVATAVSRGLEVRADTAATLTEAHGPTYASALEKLHQANQVPAVFPERQQTHPHLYDRMLAAGVEPAYPRPAPASAMSLNGTLFSGLFGVLAAIHVLRLLEVWQ